MINNSKRLYISGFWYIKNNPKRNLNHYLKTLKMTLLMIKNSNLLFYYNVDDKLIKELKFLCNEYNINLLLKKRIITKLPKYHLFNFFKNQVENYFESYDGKKLTNKQDIGFDILNNIYTKSKVRPYILLQIIWHSKIDLVYESLNTFNNFKEYAWIDISISRKNFRRKNWFFHYINCDDKKIYLYDSLMKKNNINQLSGSFFLGEKNTFIDFCKRYDYFFQKCLHENYPNTEEVIFRKIYESDKNYIFRLQKKRIKMNFLNTQYLFQLIYLLVLKFKYLFSKYILKNTF